MRSPTNQRLYRLRDIQCMGGLLFSHGVVLYARGFLGPAAC